LGIVYLIAVTDIPKWSTITAAMAPVVAFIEITPELKVVQVPPPGVEVRVAVAPGHIAVAPSIDVGASITVISRVPIQPVATT
jgi:hypothetical protein